RSRARVMPYRPTSRCVGRGSTSAVRTRGGDVVAPSAFALPTGEQPDRNHSASAPVIFGDKGHLESERRPHTPDLDGVKKDPDRVQMRWRARMPRMTKRPYHHGNLREA